MRKELIFGLALGLAGCNFANSDEPEEKESVTVIEPVDSLPETPPPPPAVNYRRQAVKLVDELARLEKRLTDSLNYTSAPPELQEELLLQYKQLSQRALKQRRTLEELLAQPDPLLPAAKSAVGEAHTTAEDIEGLLAETDKLY